MQAGAGVDGAPVLLIGDAGGDDLHRTRESHTLKAVAQHRLGHGGTTDVSGAHGNDPVGLVGGGVGLGQVGRAHGPIVPRTPPFCTSSDRGLTGSCGKVGVGAIRTP